MPAPVKCVHFKDSRCGQEYSPERFSEQQLEEVKERQRQPSLQSCCMRGSGGGGGDPISRSRSSSGSSESSDNSGSIKVMPAELTEQIYSRPDQAPVNLASRDNLNAVGRRRGSASYGFDNPLGLISSGAVAPLFLYTNLKGKFHMWDELISNIPDEDFDGPVLDIGSGRGLVLLKLAARKRQLAPLCSSLTYGIDICPSSDHSGNSPLATLANAAAEGLGDSIVLHSGSFSDKLPFKDKAFSLVTSSLAVHNVDENARVKAVWEIARVCDHGGTVIILDLAPHTRRYVKIFKSLGWIRVHSKWAGLEVMYGILPCNIVIAKRPI